MNILFRLFISSVLLASGLLIPSLALASKYSPEGIYDPVIYKLDNGLRVILNPRHAARNVSVRLNVGIGHYDFPCDVQETAHFLEHLLFTGTSEHTETELDDIVTLHGGYWNAGTYTESTVYEVDIYSEHADVGLATLSEIMQDSTITKENFEQSKEIIYRENGGKPTQTGSFLYQHELVRSASAKRNRILFDGSRLNCNNLDMLEKVRYQDAVDAYRKYYVSSNMSLIIVGDFIVEEVKKQVQQLFGKIPSKKVDRDIPRSRDFTEGPIHLSGSFNPFIGKEGKSSLAYRINGYGSPEYYPFIVIESYLNDRLYEVIRVQEGLSYSPGAGVFTDIKDGMFVVSAESKLEDIEQVTMLLEREVNLLRDGKVSDEEINKTIKSELLGWAQGIESNSEIADYYVDSLDDLDTYDRFLNQEDVLEAITPAEVRSVAKAFLTPSRMVYVKSIPTITYNQFYLLIALLIVLVLFFIGLMIRRVKTLV
jgi:zinc protease